MAYISATHTEQALTSLFHRMATAWDSWNFHHRRRRVVATLTRTLDDRLLDDIGLPPGRSAADDASASGLAGSANDRALMRHMGPSPWWGPGNDARVDYWLRERALTDHHSNR
ncbi:MAG: DUF1127 domain-containing protein [Alphaproteobacteria bacterium]|nr:DUF1127 domain-containing protein [Alphaproteobacteria bacterium]